MNLPTTPYSRLFLIALLLYWIALFIGTHLSLDEGLVIDEDNILDKFMHVGAFAGLTFLYFFSVMIGRRLSIPRYFLWLLPLVIYGALDEVTQPLTGRECDILDWYSDLAGIPLGLAMALLSQRFFKKGPQATSPDHFLQETNEA